MRKLVSLKTLVLVLALGCLCSFSRGADNKPTASKDSVRQLIATMRAEVAYLDSEHTPQDEIWSKYKDKAKALTAKCEKAVENVGDGTEGTEKLAALEKQLNELRSQVPLRLPAGPPGAGRFGAYYARLKFSYDWDRLWRVGSHPDVVVRFDEFDHRFVFWRGTSYIPCWATYDGAWFTNEFFERRGHLGGCNSMCEPMSDKQTRYSHVRILESNDARVVVHWRYSPVDLDYNLPYVDKLTGWGDSVDEYYTIYPDSVGVRKATIHSSSPKDHWIEYQESIVINQPGTIPEDNINYDAVSFANLQGKSKTYIWTEDGGPRFRGAPSQPCIQVVNFKNKYKPFSVVNPDGVRIKPYGGHGHNSHFNWWNHWPGAQEKSDTTHAVSADKPSHSSLSHITWKLHDEDEISRTWVMLNGMTDKPAGELAPIAKSWLSPAELKLPGLTGRYFTNEGYDQTQRAYVLSCSKAAPLKIELDASEDSPIVNPAFVVKGWGTSKVCLTIDGKEIKPGKDFRFGHTNSLQDADLIVWLRKESTRPVRIQISPPQDGCEG